jgi:hypothetical protein
MRIVPLLLLIFTTGRSENIFGAWKLDLSRSTAAYPGSLAIRIEPHTKGEVFTVDRFDAEGHGTTVSTILYLDGKPRTFQDATCSGTQRSRRVDGSTVEIIRDCGSDGQVRLVRRVENSGLLVLEITEQKSDGNRSERRLVLEKR